MVDLVDRFDWAATAIGARERWSETLRITVDICLHSRFPMIVFWGPELVQIYNEAYVSILGEKHPRALGQRAADCWPESWAYIGPMLDGVLRTNDATWAEDLLVPLRRDGRVEDRFFTFSCSPVREGSHVGGVFCAVTETTAVVLRERDARQRAEELAELDRAKTAFVSDVGHELRTPLTLVLGPLDELRTVAGEEQLELVAMAHRNALRLLKLVDTLLQFSRIEAGRADASFARTDLSALTADVVSMFRSAIDHAGLRLMVDIVATTPAYVDRSMWESIVLNLLSNAVKFTRDGTITVTLAEVRGRVRLSIGDTGAGIAPAELPQLFERFNLIRSSPARTLDGSGIGLALVRGLVRLHGGTIDVESELERGTIFHVDVPLGRSHLDPTQIVESAPSRPSTIDRYLADVRVLRVRDRSHESTASSQRIARVLVVEDDEDLREYLAHVLSPLYDVEFARNGSDARARLASRTFAVVIGDVAILDADGFALVRHVREELGDDATRFILLTAVTDDERAVAGMAFGADDHLLKPFVARDLLARVRAQIAVRTHRSPGDVDPAEHWFDRAGDPSTNEAAFRVFADQLPIMLFQQDVDGAISFTNRHWHEALRLPRDPSSHTVDAWRRFMHPDDLDRALSTVSDAIETRQPWQAEFRLRPADADLAESRWHVARGFPYHRKDGEFRGWNCSSVDVHETRVREESERLLRQAAASAELELRAMADTILALIYATDADGAITWYNSRWYEYTGQTRDEAVGWGWQTIIHPDDFAQLMDTWPRCVASGEPFDMEFRMRRHDGVFHYFLSRAVPVRDANGTIERWFGSCVDVNEQKLALERSRQVAQTLQGAFVPGPLPQSSSLHVDTVYQAADADALIGGDWVDAIELTRGRYLFAIGDVTGHGFDASIVAARLRHAITDFALVTDSPADVLENVNAVAQLEHPGVYASALVAFFDADTLRFTYASAGHHGPLLAEDSHSLARSLPVGGCLLGVDAKLGSVDRTIDVAPESVIAFFTDGIVEFSRDLVDAEERLARAVASLVDTAYAHPAAHVRDLVLQGAATNDDVAILTIQFSRFALANGVPNAIDLVKRWRFHSSDASAAQRTRHEIMRYVRAYAADDDGMFEAELVLGELLANTVEHAPGLVEIRIDWSGDEPIVSVSDVGPGFQAKPTALPATELAEAGRGLFIVREFARDVRMRPAGEGGSELVVRLPLRRKSS